jgi:ABC-type branched-subunit amino acid transport system ATPase component
MQERTVDLRVDNEVLPVVLRDPRRLRDRDAASVLLEVALLLATGAVLAGAPRLILFDEPAAGLSPAERGELVALLGALPEHMGYILIEHDLDIALRVVDRVTVMHNGRVLKHGSPAEIEDDAEVQAIYMGGKHH